eukprot:NODE_7991_length_730_cov_4.495881_g7739_i0.p1 GENE.NODE_7991_length_730_cov_4.495881_g7739_i0~~NODE_7991_length_730_cov_4.495881_g7739_i0.p1  ORF type:complete len:212 (-),score=54.58 NODE_7991_length_730_cov_4.495881_g7739_i0:94-675(-)
MAYFTNYYSASTGEHRHVCVPTPNTHNAALVPYQPMSVVPYFGTQETMRRASEASTSTAPLSSHVWSEPTVAVQSSPLGPQITVPQPHVQAPYSSWWHPKTYGEVVHDIASHPATPTPMPPTVTMASTPIGHVMMTPSPHSHVQPSTTWHAPPTYESVMTDYANRPSEPMLTPLNTSSVPRTRIVGRVQRTIM